MTENSNKRIGVLGGTFDPVHNGHLCLAKEALEQFHLDQILFIPANLSPHKTDSPATPSHHRLAMLRLVTRSEPAFKTSDIEILAGGISFAIDTMDALKKLMATAELHIIMGMDTFLKMDTWKEAARLMKENHIIVGSRAGMETPPPEQIIANLFGGKGAPYTLSADAEKKTFQHAQSGRVLGFFSMRPWEVSASQIRESVGKNSATRNLLPADVENYIIENQLYQSDPSLDQVE